MGLTEFYNELQSEIPSTDTVIAVILLIVNIFFPGWGTAVMACIGGFKIRTLLVAVVQFFTAFIIIGWIWSIWWGILCLQRAK